jgi:hypothetical protein
MNHYDSKNQGIAKITKVGKCDRYASITVLWDGVKAIAETAEKVGWQWVGDRW